MATTLLGGAVYAGLDTELIVKDCIFDNNTSGHGGAVHSSAETTFTNCQFTNNSADYDGDGGGGGAVHSYPSPATTTFTDCSFLNNSASRGGAVHSADSTFTRCTFTGNTASFTGNNPYFTNTVSYDGAAIWSVSSSITKSAFTGNTATNNGTIYAFSSTLVNCLFSNNHASCGGAIYYPLSSPLSKTPDSSHDSTLTNCTFTLNDASEQGGGIWCSLDPANTTSEDTLTITNCILWGNTAQDKTEIYEESYGSLTITYSDIGDDDYIEPDDTNVNSNPKFSDASNNKLQIDDISSLCLDNGTAVGAPTDDYDGNDRPFPSDGNFDMGAYERQSTISIDTFVSTPDPPTGGPESLEVTFNCVANDDTYGIEKYEWYNFEDLQSTTMVNLEHPVTNSTWVHTFSGEGDYVVKCTVYNRNEETLSATKTVSIVPNNLPPTADAGDDQIVAGCSVYLDGSGSKDNDNGTISWSWDLHYMGKQCNNLSGNLCGDLCNNDGNDISVIGETPPVTDLIYGYYCVTLTVTDDDNATSIDRMFLAVAADPDCDDCPAAP